MFLDMLNCESKKIYSFFLNLVVVGGLISLSEYRLTYSEFCLVGIDVRFFQTGRLIEIGK